MNSGGGSGGSGGSVVLLLVVVEAVGAVVVLVVLLERQIERCSRTQLIPTNLCNHLLTDEQFFFSDKSREFRFVCDICCFFLCCPQIVTYLFLV